MGASRLLVLESDAADNRANIPREWFERMEALPEAESRRYLRCCHDDFEGMVFSAFGPANLVPAQVAIPRTWPIVRGFDPGVTGAGWVWVAVATGVKPEHGLPATAREGSIICFQELAAAERPLQAQLRAVMAYEAQAGGREPLSPLYTAIDPGDARAHTESGIHNVADLVKRHAYALEGLALSEEERYDYAGLEVLPWFGALRKAPNDESAFILKAQQGFADGTLLVRENCRDLIRQLRTEVYVESLRGERRRRYGQPFHVLSAWKYALLSEPERFVAESYGRERPRFRTTAQTGY